VATRSIWAQFGKRVDACMNGLEQEHSPEGECLKRNKPPVDIQFLIFVLYVFGFFGFLWFYGRQLE